MKALLWSVWRGLPESVRTFARRVKEKIVPRKMRLNFDRIYANNSWGNSESFSGSGSTLAQTEALRRALPALFHKLEIKSLLDLPCGDFNWMRHVDYGDIRYTGGDIVARLVARNQALFGNDARTFLHLDAIRGPLPKADLIFCRDCFVHLPFADALNAVRAFRASGSRWLLATTFTDCECNEELPALGWRVLNLRKAPFAFPVPEELIVEHCTENNNKYADKSMGLWRLDSLPVR